MSARGLLTTVGTAVGGLIGWPERQPEADPASVRRLLEDLGWSGGSDDRALAEAVGAFQRRVGLEPDGVAGPKTVHHLVRYANEARELRHLDLAA